MVREQLRDLENELLSSNMIDNLMEMNEYSNKELLLK